MSTCAGSVELYQNHTLNSILFNPPVCCIFWNFGTFPITSHLNFIILLLNSHKSLVSTNLLRTISLSSKFERSQLQIWIQHLLGSFPHSFIIRPSLWLLLHRSIYPTSLLRCFACHIPVVSLIPFHYWNPSKIRSMGKNVRLLKITLISAALKSGK